MGRSTTEHNAGPKKRFGVFEFDPQVRELAKHGVRLKLQEQPMQILAALLEQAGRIVPRDELKQRLWPAGTFVDYEQSLNKAVNKLREALGDSADHPIYIETLARRGYRFLAPVESDGTVESALKTLAPRRGVPLWLSVSGFVLAIVLASGLWPIEAPQVERVAPLTNDTTPKFGLISDGNSVLYYDAGGGIWSVPVSGGEPKKLPLPFLRQRQDQSKVANLFLVGYSSIRQEICLRVRIAGESGEDEFWLVGTQGEAPRKIGAFNGDYGLDLAPDAKRIALSTPDGIYIQSIENGGRKRIHAMSGTYTNGLWWHPSGHTVGFLDNPADISKTRAWQVNDDGTHLRRLVPEIEQPLSGTWSQDGRRFFYTGVEGEVFVRIQRSILGWLRKPVVTRLTTSGQFRAGAAIDPVNQRRLYAVGSVDRGEAMRYDRKARRWGSFLGGLSGENMAISPDGQWVAYVDFPGSVLHKRRIDGSSDVLLAPGVLALNPSWSPDGRRIAFPGCPAGTLVRLKLWLVSSEGGDAAPYSPETESGFDTIWSGDGRRILLGGSALVQSISIPSHIRILDLETGKVEVIPGTESLYSPRWSPDEKQILAIEDRTFRARIFDPVKGEWRLLTEEPIGYPNWSRDGKYIYAQTGSRSTAKAIRIEVATGRGEEIARMDFNTTGNFNYWVGWTKDWEPLTLRDVGSRQIYRLDLDR